MDFVRARVCVCVCLIRVLRYKTEPDDYNVVLPSRHLHVLYPINATFNAANICLRNIWYKKFTST